ADETNTHQACEFHRELRGITELELWLLGRSLLFAHAASHRFSTSTAFCPPRPKLCLVMAPISIDWDSVTMLSPTSGSGSLWLRVSGTFCSCMVKTAMAVSSAPEAAMACPKAPFTDVTGMVDPRSPSASLIAFASAWSPAGVDAACALTW